MHLFGEMWDLGIRFNLLHIRRISNHLEKKLVQNNIAFWNENEEEISNAF